MGKRLVQFPILMGLAICSLTLVPAECQVPVDPTGQPLPDNNPDCPPLTAFHALPMSKVNSCQKGKNVEVAMPLRPSANGEAQQKRVRGVYEFREYLIPELEREYAFDHLMKLLPMNGFTVRYSYTPSTITAQRDDTWILINVNGESYSVSVVVAAEEPWTPVKTADEIAREMNAHGRVDIYGIQFSPRDQLIQEKSDILIAILYYLSANSDLSIVIESHKISTTGTPEEDSEITKERANAVTDWLIAHGIARSRVQPRPCGRDNPIANNDSPQGAQRNERIVLVKANS